MKTGCLAKKILMMIKKDAGELGSGHTVTALYEIIPAGVESEFLKTVDALKYQKQKKSLSGASKEIFTLKFRYKKPTDQKSKLIIHPVVNNDIALENTSDNFRFAAAVAEYGLLLRNSEFKSASTYQQVLETAQNAFGKDEEGYRTEFVALVKKSQSCLIN